MELSGRRRVTPQLNLTALIDVVFILLIFVVLAASFERIRELKVNLPQVSADGRAAAAELVVTVPPSGDVLVDGRAVAAEDLRAALQAARGERGSVLLLVDAAASAERAVQVLSSVRSAGFEAVSIATREPAR